MIKILNAIVDFITGEGYLRSSARAILFLGIIVLLLSKVGSGTTGNIALKVAILLILFVYFSIYRLINRNNLPDKRAFKRKIGIIIFIVLSIILYFSLPKLQDWLNVFNAVSSPDLLTQKILIGISCFIFVIGLYLFSIENYTFAIFGEGKLNSLIRFLLTLSVTLLILRKVKDSTLLIFISSFLFIYFSIYRLIIRTTLPEKRKSKKMFGLIVFLVLSAGLFIFLDHQAKFANILNNNERLPLYLIIVFLLNIISIFLWFVGRTKPEELPYLLHKPDSYSNFEGEGIYVGTPMDYHAPGYGKLFQDYKDKDILIDPAILSKTTLIVGDMGQGKTRLMKIYYDKIKQLHPNAPIIIHDPKGEWVKSCYNPETDIIFSPFDKRSVGWDIWKDFKAHPELIHLISKSVVTTHHKTISSDGNYWVDSATELLQNGIIDSNDIYELARKFCEEKEKEKGNKTFLSTYVTAKLALKDIASISLIKSEKKMTLDDFITHKGNIFLLNPVVARGENKGPLSIFLTAFLMNALSRPDVQENTLQMTAIIDESLLFELPDEVEDAVYTMARSKGVAIIASILALPLEHHQKTTHLTKSQTIFTFRCSDLKTREYFSNSIGNIMYDEKRTSITSSVHGGSSTETFERRQDKAIFQEMFNNLNKREYFLMRDGLIKGYLPNVDMESKNHEVLAYNMDLKQIVQKYIKAV